MSFLFSWFSNFLEWLGFGEKTGTLVLLGLDNAGKTTLLYKLKDGTNRQFSPTIQPSSEQLEIEGIKFCAHDLGGHPQARQLWKDYYAAVDAIIFMIDASNEARLPEATNELWQLLKTEELSDVPFVILGNKVDKKTALRKNELESKLNISTYLTGQTKQPTNRRPVELFMCSVTKGYGYSNAFKWVSQYL